MKNAPLVVRLIVLMVFGAMIYLNNQYQLFKAAVLYYQDKNAQQCQADYTQLLSEIRDQNQIPQYADQVKVLNQSCARLMGSVKEMEQLPEATKKYLLDRVMPSWMEISKRSATQVHRIMALKGGEALLFPERFTKLDDELLGQSNKQGSTYYRQYARQLIASAQILMDYYNGRGDELEIAHRLIQSVLAEDANYAPAYVALARYVLATTNTVGRRYRDNGLNRSKALLDKALILDGDLAAAHSLLGYWNIQSFHLTEAQVVLDKARKLDANDPWVEVNQGRLYEKEFLNDQAKSAYHYKMAAQNEVLPSLPRAIAYGSLTESECRKGDVLTAKQYYAEMVKLKPNISWARGNLITAILFDCADIKWAEQVSKETLDQLNYSMARGNYGWVLFAKAAHLHAAGQKKQALIVWQQALQLADNYQEFYIRAAEIRDHELFVEIYNHLPQLGAVKPSGRARHGKTMLHLAIVQQRSTNARWLIAQGAAVNIQDDLGFTPLHHAAETGQVDIMQLLKQHGADVNLNSKLSGMSPLMQAIEFKQDAAAFWLIENGAEINNDTKTGITALGHAVNVGNLKVAEALLKSGADRGVKLYGQYTLQQAAIELKNDNMLALLKQYPGTE